MTTQEKTKTDEARIVAQKLANLEIDRKAIVEEMTDLKSQFETLVEEGADSSYDVNGATVFISNTISYSVPDGLKQEIEARVKDNTKVSQELITKYFNQDLKPTRKALKTLRQSADPDLSQLVVQEEKSKVAIKV